MYLGIYKDLSIEDYHGDVDSISRSSIMELKKSPFHYWNSYLNPNKPKKEPTDAMNIGNALHTLVLEPELFDKRFMLAPEKVLLKDVGREKYEAYKAQLERIENKLDDKILLTAKQYEMINKMHDSIRNHRQASHLLNGAECEQSLFWVDEHTGIRCKIRPDIWQSSIIADIKTIDDASERSFQYAMVDHGYHIQAAMIKEGIREVIGYDIDAVVFIVVEKKFPYTVATYVLDQISLDYGLVDFKNQLLKLKSCRDTNNWEGYENKVISLPNWAFTQ